MNNPSTRLRQSGQHLPSGTVTFLFTDIEGSTKLAQQYPDQWESLRARHHSILQSAIERYNGYAFQIIGDAFCVAFHTAGDALRAATKSQIELHANDWGDTPIKVRMGIHTGKAEIQENGEYHGYLAMSRIQRLMSAGHGGQVLISAATQELLLEDVAEGVSLRDLGERRLKDLIRPEHIYQLVIPGLPVDFPRLKTLDFYRHNLPVQLTSFVGRENEIKELRQALSQHRLITLTGMGGTGKTRLSLQVAADLLDEFPDGVWLIELAPVSDPDLVVQAVLSCLGIPEQPGLTILQMLLDYLRTKKLLLVLDNCEHLIEACAELVVTLLSDASSIKILATSREGLGVAGEMIWHVPSLSLPDPKHVPALEQLSQYEAVQLFIERAALVQPRFLVTSENAPAVAQICYRLDGIPLAIELAAARVRGLSAEQIAARLDDRFHLLTGGSRTALPRQRTLQAAIDWSYNLLSEQECLLLRRLAVFAGGWTLEVAEQVCANDELASDQILDLLLNLVDKSLVVAKTEEIHPRYYMLETTRQYAHERCVESSEYEWLQNRHLDFFINLAEESESKLLGSEQLIWLEQLESEQGNLRAALKWGFRRNAEAGCRLASALWIFWFMHAHFIEGQQWYEEALSIDITSSPTIQMRLLIGAASNAMGQGDYERTAAFSEQSLILAREQKHNWGIVMSLHHLGTAATAQGDYKQAQTLLEEGLALSRGGGNWELTSYMLADLSSLARVQGDYPKARAYQKEAIALAQKHNDRWGTAYGLQYLGFLDYQKGDYGNAKILIGQAITLVLEFGDKRLLAGLLELLGMIAFRQGRLERAAQLISIAEALSKLIGITFTPEEPEIIVSFRNQLGEDTYEAIATAGRALTLEQAIAFALEENDE